MSREIIDATIRLENTGRTPVAPLVDHFAGKYCGLDVNQFMKDGDKRLEAILKVNKDLGPWDLVFLGETANFDLLRMGVPIDLEIGEETHQFIEGDYLDSSLYVDLNKTHPFFWMRKLLSQKHEDFKGVSGLLKVARVFYELRKQTKSVRKQGYEPALGFVTAGPFLEYASMGRGLENFCYDLFDERSKIKEAGSRYTHFMTQFSTLLAKYIGTPRVFIGLARSSTSFISPQDFEELVLPDLEIMVNGYVSNGITPIFHCDSDWTGRLDYFKKFPAKRCILELDGTTDIRKAKEVLGDRMAIMGDVPATTLAFGSYDDTFRYCKDLIRDVGNGRGFILSSGCSVPPNAKPENVRAMYDAAHD